MKKIIFIPVLFFVLVGTAFASFNYFADESKFEEWYESSALTMLAYDVIQGYDDREFKPENNVNRAELAVILDRFAENILHLDLFDEPFNCTQDIVEGLVIYLQDNNGDAISETKITTTSNEIIEESNESGVYEGLYEGLGYYTLSIKKEGYSEHIETIKLEHGDCHVITQYKTITLF